MQHGPLRLQLSLTTNLSQDGANRLGSGLPGESSEIENACLIIERRASERAQPIGASVAPRGASCTPQQTLSHRIVETESRTLEGSGERSLLAVGGSTCVLGDVLDLGGRRGANAPLAQPTSAGGARCAPRSRVLSVCRSRLGGRKRRIDEFVQQRDDNAAIHIDPPSLCMIAVCGRTSKSTTICLQRPRKLRGREPSGRLCITRSRNWFGARLARRFSNSTEMWTGTATSMSPDSPGPRDCC